MGWVPADPLMGGTRPAGWRPRDEGKPVSKVETWPGVRWAGVSQLPLD